MDDLERALLFRLAEIVEDFFAWQGKGFDTEKYKLGDLRRAMRELRLPVTERKII